MDVHQIYSDYTAGESLKALAKRLRVDSRTITRRFNEAGLRMRTASEANRKYEIVEDFFDNIDTPEKAYAFGLLMADGYNNTDRGSVALGLSEGDRDVLDHLTALIQPNKPLQFVDQVSNRRAGWKTKDQYRLVIANRHISQQLSRLGCGKAKTFSLTFPPESILPRHLLNHFVRGYFDGDGSVCNYKHKHYAKTSVSITATESFLHALQGIMQRDLDFQPVKLVCRFPERGNGITALNYSGKRKCMKLRDWLYAGATISLNRKKQVFYAI